MSERRAASYHHGALREALLDAADAILERDGIQALTLRAVARAAGVSHAAPAHHFRDLAGLLSELAALGFRRLVEGFEQAMDAAGDAPAARLQAMGRAYVGFARAHPGLFVLMFRSERLDPANPALADALAASGQALRAAVTARAPEGGTVDGVARAAAVWSLVHGFALLLIDDRLRALLTTLPPDENADTLLDAVFRVTNFTPPECAPGA